MQAFTPSPMPTFPTFIDLTGQRFGRLVVTGFAGRSGERGKRLVWRANCDCGATTTVQTSSLRSGQTTSCGCVHRETFRRLMTTHGESKGANVSAEYKIWAGMRGRCNNPRNQDYPYYGGRGIRVCRRDRGQGDQQEGSASELHVRDSLRAIQCPAGVYHQGL